MFSNITDKSRLLLTSTAALALATSMMYAPMAGAIVPTDEVGPEDSVDTEGGVNGVGMFFRADGFVCTGTLINPRTVLFAAHCVNDVPEGTFGSTLPAAWSFNVDALPGFQTWFGNGFQSDIDANVFNINQLFWNSASVENPASRGFLEADIALASLDTPAAHIPTWALLFSALPAPDALTNESGTGYHVDITGYGGTGDGGFTGDNIGVDFRRRAAENYLGALASINNRTDRLNNAPLGTFDGAALPQNLYWTDFDAPNGDDLFFDFNNYLDDALPNEGTTAGGDSGGPLILDAANNDITDIDIIIGVLSGGSNFFGASNIFGSSSLYQPLYAFYDYIAANNPYRYVSALEGDGNWEDASHWVTDLDPNYYILDENNAIVNGFPDAPEAGRGATERGFGAICVQGFAGNLVDGDDCLDVATGEYFSAEDDLPDGDNVPDDDDDGTATPAIRIDNNLARLDTDTLDGLGLTTNNIGAVETNLTQVTLDTGNVQDVAITANVSNDEATEETVTPVTPTIENGRAGATDFVPDNVERDDDAGLSVRYFDVTLSADGTTTLSSDVTIDRLTVNGAGARLDIAESGSLTSLIDIEQVNGWVDVNGQISSVGDYLLMSGMLTGSGTLQAPFFTNVMGGIAPGGMGDIDTLTIDGSAILASASGLLIDIGSNGESDVLAITGDSSLGGEVVFAPTADVRAGNQYVFVTTDGEQTGEFAAPAAISTLLTPVLSYTENSVIATIEAGTYADAIDGTNAVQSSYAELLDDSRGAAALASVFASLDLAAPGDIQAVLDSWAPVTETTVRSLAKASTENLVRFHRNRLSGMANESWGGGTVTVMGSPLQLASNDRYATVMSDTGVLMASSEANVRTTNNIPDDMAVYLSGSFIDGESAAMPTAQNFANEDFDGWSVTGGVEKRVNEKASIGASLSYTQLEAEASLGQIAETDYFAGTVYGQLRAENNVFLDGQLSLGSLNSQTERTIAFPAANVLSSDDDSTIFSADLQLSKAISTGTGIFTPRVSLQNTLINFDRLDETGGVPALSIDRNGVHSTQGRIGVAFSTAPDAQFDLSLHGDLVNEFGTIEDDFGARFAGIGAGDVDFNLFGTDKTWGEVGMGLGFGAGATKFDISAETTLGRKDFEARVYRASVSYKF